ncbi:MAG: D-aminoacylase [Planctomycetia bacterium]|nr:D-aminoacylase [Planctomycetia bacterium]
MYDLVIRGGTVVDGSGRQRYEADVAIRGDRIAVVGKLDPDDALNVLDARGLVVAPGFIDVHNHSDGWLLRQPNFASKTLQGVTTEVLMSDGISYAPTSAELRREWIYYLRSLNGLQQADDRGWRTLEDYYSQFEGRTAQNVVAQIPYANLRVLASGWNARTLDDRQLRAMRAMVEEGMAAGAVGVSTGLDYVNQCHASTEELVEVIEAAAPFGGIYVTHIRYKRGLIPALCEAVAIAQRANVKLHVSHLKADTPEEIDAVLGCIDSVAVNVVDFSFDVYPYLPGSTMLNSLLPYEAWDDGPLGVVRKLGQPAIRERFAFDLATVYRPQLERIRIAWVPSKANACHQGSSLAEYIAAVGKSPVDALCDLLIEEGLAVLCVFHRGDDALVEPFLKHEKFMVGSDGIFQPDGPVHPRQFGSFPRLIGPLVRDRRWFTLEEAVRKATSIPAARFGLIDRGTVCVGAFADLVLFDPATVADRATFDEPRQTPIGIAHVFVAGRPIVAEGKPLDLAPDWPGRWLKYKH